jgi:hypothetical protein
MSKSNKTASEFFKKKNSKKKEDFKEAFEVRPASPTTTDIFMGLDAFSDADEEKLRLELFAMSKESGINQADAERDCTDLLLITSEIRSITKQSIILHGERIHKARSILNKYKKRAFMRWLDITYGNRQTPYNFLYYYNLYKAVPQKEQTLIQKMPVRAAYLLSSRDGDMEKKLEIIRRHANSSQKELITVIRKEFPTSEGESKRRREGSRSLAKSFLQNLRALLEVEKPLSPSCISMLEQGKKILEELLK